MDEGYLSPLDSVDEGQDEPRGLSFREVIVALRRRWWVVALLASVVLVAGIAHTWRQPRLYQATSTVRLQAAQQPINGVATASPRLDYRIDPLQSEQVLIKSEQVAERVVRDLGLRLAIVTPPKLRWSEVFTSEYPQVSDSATTGTVTLLIGDSTFALSAGGQVSRARYGARASLGGVSLTLARRPQVDAKTIELAIMPMMAAINGVRGSIDTHVLPSTDLIEISYTGQDPRQVRDITNAVASTYESFSTEGQRDAAVQKTRFIEQSLQEQEVALRSAQDALKQFKEANQTADASDEAKQLFTSIASFETEQQQLLTEQKVYQSLMGKVAAADTIDDELRRLAGTGILQKNAAILAKFDEWQDLAKKRQELMVTSGVNDNNADVQRYDHAISDAKKGLRAATEVYLQGLQTRLESLAQTIAQMKGQSERYPPLEAEQLRLAANVDAQQKMYMDLQSQYQLARIAQSANGGTVRIIDAATLPTYAVSPNRKRAFLIYLFLGLLTGVGSAVGLERLDDSVRSPLELGESFRLPVLGLIPAIKASEMRELPAGPGLNRIVTHADPRSPVAEAYRSLRTNLAFAKSDRGLRTVVLTSPGPADGKSTTVANLAITFAQQGQKTLLVDADLRRAVLDRTFGVERTPGLTDVIIGEKKLSDAVSPTQVPNLSVLPSGQLPPNPSELLGSSAMAEVIRQAKEQYDRVLFDSPPLLAVTDAAVLSTMVDGTILIARMGATQRKALWRAMAQLRAVRAPMLGGVLNDVSAQVGSYYGGYGYYYYYSYYGDSGSTTGQLGVMARLRRLTAGRLGARA